MKSWHRTLAALAMCCGIETLAGAQSANADDTAHWVRQVGDCMASAAADVSAGRYGDALDWAETAVRLSEMTPGMPARDAARASVLLGSILEHLGRRGDGIASYRKAIAKYQQDPSADGSTISSVRRRLAALLLEQGSQPEARAEARRSFLTETASRNPRLAASQLESLAGWFSENGDQAAAEAAYADALKLLSAQPGAADQVATLKSELAVLLQSAGRNADAEAAFRRELDHALQIQPQDPSKVALAHAGIGSALLGSGKCADAQHEFEQALRGFALNHPSVASTRDALALSLVCQGDAAGAAKQMGLVAQAFAAPAAQSGPSYARFLDTAVWVAWAGYDVDQTLRLLQASNQARKPVTTALLKTRTESGRRGYLDAMKGRVDTAISFALTDARKLPQAAAASYEALIDFKGRGLEATIEQEMARQLSSSNTLNTLNTIQGRMDEVTHLVHQGDPRVALRDMPAVSLQSIQRGLGPTDALVEFAFYTPSSPRQPGRPTADPHYAAYVVRGQALPGVVDLGSASTINQQVTQALGQLVAKATSYQQSAERLYAAVFAPLVPLLGHAVNLYIAPDSDLALLPFAALVDESHQYLIKRYQTTYLTSGRDLLRVTHRIVPRSQPKLFAAPSYDAAGQGQGGSPDALLAALGLSSFGPLTGTLEEAKALAPILGQFTKVYTGGDATEESLKAVRGPSILHVATHGFYVDGSAASGSGGRSASKQINAAIPGSALPASNALPPLQRSGLALAGANRAKAPGDDGILTAEEALFMDLQGTQLVTLSACDTARGKTSVGEGVWGLRRALAAAGAETQVITLWRLEDEPTVKTMKNYYTRLRKGEGRSAALRSTQLEMVGQHPYYWASFIVAGDPSPLHDSVIMPSFGE